MTRDPLLIRVDATVAKGYERLARCLTLAAAVQRRRRPVHFLSQLEPNTLAMPIKRGGNDWVAMSHPAGTAADLPQFVQEIHRLHPAAVVVDDADAGNDYLAEVIRSGVLVVSIDHLALSRFPARLVVNPLLGPSRESYEFGPRTQLLLGRRYALVRPEIRRNRAARSQEPPPVTAGNGKAVSGQFRALISLGEDDPNRQVLELARLLLNTPKVGKVDVAIRREHPDLDALVAMKEAAPERLDLALEPAEVAARVARCHFAITAGGGWSLELACVGVPQLLILQNEAHWPNAQRLEEEGCATCLGWHENVSAHTIRLAVQNLLTDPLERQAMARCGRKLIDSRGPDRLVTALEILLSPARQVQAARQAA
jgi:spore coat polysaccharide biosynthesis predicted glycosyltransferase SpsG